MTIRKIESCPPRGYVDGPQTWASLGVLLLLVVEELGDVGAADDEAEDAEVEQRVQLIDDLAAQRRLEIRGGRDQYLLACQVAQAGGEATLPLQHFRINSRSLQLQEVQVKEVKKDGRQETECVHQETMVQPGAGAGVPSVWQHAWK